jgi:tetratricopeptide (TPR) repeat protein
MTLTLSNRESGFIETRGTRDFDAYDAFLIGQQQIRTRSKQGYQMSLEAYRRAIEIDPGYARAYSGIAVALTHGYRYQWSDLTLVEARERALKFARKAVALNQSTPQIYWALGFVHVHRHEYDAAETAAEQSIALSPNYADGHALLAYIANWRGKPEEAVRHVKQAAALNPFHTFEYPSILGLAYYNLGRYDDAVAALRDSLDRNESALNPRLFLAAAYVRLNRIDEAEWEIARIGVNRPDATIAGLETILPYERESQMVALREDLRAAGLPE